MRPFSRIRRVGYVALLGIALVANLPMSGWRAEAARFEATRSRVSKPGSTKLHARRAGALQPIRDSQRHPTGKRATTPQQGAAPSSGPVGGLSRIASSIARSIRTGAPFSLGGIAAKTNEDGDDDHGDGDDHDGEGDDDQGGGDTGGGDDGSGGDDDGTGDTGDTGGDQTSGDGDGSGDLDGQPYVAAEVTAELLDKADPAIVAGRHGFRVLEALAGTNIYRFGLRPNLSVQLGASELSFDNEVKKVEANFLTGSPEVQQRSAAFIDQRSAAFIDGTSPGNYFDQEALTRMHADEAHAFSRGEGIVVAVIDTGIEITHPLFKGRLVDNKLMYDFVDGDTDPSEASSGIGTGHGTFVSGLVVLAAPDARILPLRAFNRDGEATTFNISKAIIYAVRMGASVINMSFALPGRSFVVEAAINFAHQPQDTAHPELHPAVLVASAGNGNTADPVQYPAASPFVYGVASTNAKDQKSDFSNFGSYIAVSAPGEGVYSAFVGGRWATWSGTSFAAAFVSGEAAIVLSSPVNLGKADCVSSAISKSADPIDALNPGYEGRLGSGRINMLESVRFLCAHP